MRPLNKKETAFLRDVRVFRAAGMKWPEIAERMGDTHAVVYSRFQRYELRELRSKRNVAA